MNVYKHCPMLASERLALRPVDPSDAPELLNVYSNKEMLRLCSSDNCTYGFRNTPRGLLSAGRL